MIKTSIGLLASLSTLHNFVKNQAIFKRNDILLRSWNSYWYCISIIALYSFWIFSYFCLCSSGSTHRLIKEFWQLLRFFTHCQPKWKYPSKYSNFPSKVRLRLSWECANMSPGSGHTQKWESALDELSSGQCCEATAKWTKKTYQSEMRKKRSELNELNAMVGRGNGEVFSLSLVIIIIISEHPMGQSALSLAWLG